MRSAPMLERLASPHVFPACQRFGGSTNLCRANFLREGPIMARILVIHGAGMNMRGKVQTEIFGPMTLPEYDERIRGYAAELGVEVEIFHSNIEGELINKLYEANDKGFDAALFNPAGFSSGYPALVAAISQVRFPTIEIHISNPVRRGPVSETARVSHGMITGFGLPGYYLALRGVRDMLAANK
jgi:3-dehydroquinate dehydratase II